MSSRAQNAYLNFTRINATSYACLAESVLLLYALKVGADDFLVSFIASFTYLSALFMPLGKISMAHHGAVQTISRAWVLRNFSAFLLVLVPIVQQLVSPKHGLALFVLAAFGFFSFRGLGLTAFNPLVGEITSPENRGKFIAKNTMQSNIFYLAAMFIIVLLINRYPALKTFQGIVLFGCVMGVVAGLVIRKLQESDRPLLSAREPILSAIDLIKKTPAIQRLLLAAACATTALMLTIPFSMLTLKKGFLLSDDAALIFASMQLVGAIISSYANTLLLDRVGPRPIMIIYTSVVATICVLWIVLPISWIWTVGIAVFLLIGAANAGIQTSLSHYLLSSVAPEKVVSISMLMVIFSNTIAGLVGTGLGGGLLRLLNHEIEPGLMVYRVYFAVIFLLLLPIIWVVSRLQPVADRRVRDVLGILFSLREWRALFTLQKLSELRSESNDRLIIRKLEEIKSSLSEDSLAAFLSSPRFYTRLRAIRALEYIDFNDATADLLIHEVETGEFTTAYMAADVLSSHQIVKAIPVLRKALNSQDLFLQSKAMQALTLLGDRESFALIIEIFRNTQNPRLILSGAQSLVEIGKTENLHLLLEKLLLPDLADSVIDELLYCVSELCHAHDLFYTFYPLLRKNPAEQDRVISFVAEQQKLEPDRRRQLLDLFDALLHSDQRCIELLSSVDALIKRMPCIQSITSFLDHHPHGDTKPVRMMVFLILLDTLLRQFQTRPHQKSSGTARH